MHKEATIRTRVHLLLMDNNAVLFQKRYDPKYGEGHGLIAGHVEEGESIKNAIIREAQEEVMITIAKEDLEIVHIMYRKRPSKIHFFLKATKWTGQLKINKDDEDIVLHLTWFPIDDLPTDSLKLVKLGVKHYQNGVVFSEYDD